MMKEENKEQKQNSAQYDPDQWKVGPKGFIALIVAISYPENLPIHRRRIK